MFNLVGRDFETKFAVSSSSADVTLTCSTLIRNFDYKSVHVSGAERIAKIAAESGVSRFIHLSHLNALENSPSKFYAAKAEGEQLVQAAFPTATIVRPATMFGYEDKLLTNIAGMLISFQFIRGAMLPTVRGSMAYLVEAKPWANKDPPGTCKSRHTSHLACVNDK